MLVHPFCRLPIRWRLFLGGVLGLFAAIAIGPDLAFRYFLMRGQTALRERSPQMALDYFQRAAKIAPSNPEVHFWIGRAYRRDGKLDLLRQHLERAWKLGCPPQSIRREEWLALAQTGQLREAEPHLTELLVNPGEDGPEICEAFVKGYFLAYRLNDALKLLEVWQADYPNDPQPHFNRGMFHSHMGNHKDAVASLRQALVLASGRKDIRLHLAQLLMATNEFAEAESLFRQLVKTDPDDPEVLVGMGKCLVERGDIQRGRQSLEQALRMAPGSHAARVAIGQLELKLGHPEESIARLRPVVADRPHDSEARFAIASALQAAGKSDEAHEHFQFVERAQQALARLQILLDKAKTDPDDAELHYEVGMILLEFGTPADGVRWLLSVLNLDPNHRPTHAALARYYRSVGNDQLAKQHEQQAGDNATGEER